jgi:hypothetical protein
MNNSFKISAGICGLLILVFLVLVAQFHPDGDFDSEKRTNIKNTGLILLYLKSQQIFLSEKGKFAENVNELPSMLTEMKEFESWQNNGDRVETWLNGTSAIISINSNSSKNKKYFGIIKSLKSKTIKETGFIVFENFSFACAGTNNNSLNNKIYFTNIATNANAVKVNNCPVGYLQIYQNLSNK